MGKARRCRSVVFGASVVALGATGACPAANAASAPGSHGPRAAVAHKHAPPRRHRRHKAVPSPASRHGKYVYKGVIGNTVATANEPNMACTGDGGARLTRIAFAELNGPGSFKIWAQHPAAFNKTYTLKATPTTAITVNWMPASKQREAEEEAAHTGNVSNPRLQGQNDTTTVSAVCAAAPRPGANIAEIGEATATWELPAPVTSLAELTRYAPTSITPNEYSAVFEVLPNGTVPPFTQEVENTKAH
jgi:hypothetical protein